MTDYSTAPVTTATTSSDAARLGRGLAVIRILLGATFLSNGIAKLFEFHNVHIGSYVANLIDKADAKFILNAEVNHNAKYHLPLIGRITNSLVLPHWTLFGWGLTAAELAAGILLVVGLKSRIGALVALGPTIFLFFVYFSNDRWLPEEYLVLVPLIVLALVPADRYWGLEGRLRRARHN